MPGVSWKPSRFVRFGLGSFEGGIAATKSRVWLVAFPTRRDSPAGAAPIGASAVVLKMPVAGTWSSIAMYDLPSAFRPVTTRRTRGAAGGTGRAPPRAPSAARRNGGGAGRRRLGVRCGEEGRERRHERGRAGGGDAEQRAAAGIGWRLRRV